MIEPNFKRPRLNAKHLAKVRRMPCLCCNKPGPSHAHHLRISREGGTGLKPRDETTLPLCADCHDKLHNHKDGELGFWMMVVRLNAEVLRDAMCGFAKSLVNT